LQALPVRFGGYESEVAKKILAERIEKAFEPNAMPEKFLDWLSEFSSKFGDLCI
jgi:hypothetical protein